MCVTYLRLCTEYVWIKITTTQLVKDMNHSNKCCWEVPFFLRGNAFYAHRVENALQKTGRENPLNPLQPAGIRVWTVLDDFIPGLVIWLPIWAKLLYSGLVNIPLCVFVSSSSSGQHNEETWLSPSCRDIFNCSLPRKEFTQITVNLPLTNIYPEADVGYETKSPTNASASPLSSLLGFWSHECRCFINLSCFPPCMGGKAKYGLPLNGKRITPATTITAL